MISGIFIEDVIGRANAETSAGAYDRQRFCCAELSWREVARRRLDGGHIAHRLRLPRVSRGEQLPWVE